ncbi:pyridoxal phosphate-dependent aminotransferase [Longimicrobium sp.]|uniref:pyridoxal phosphate-dependent aminotransferase n=1 Tax=Longimicrobium sp. TaxID=2029185 RepID=UPI002E307A06|nr:pyridoxal phosphate-dependent aminotransferase [Longimicrobium sp.]HEX6042251.1 pyridoxal phosphate-dependent aminotransferase [Longimicrobium sp.]
MTDRPMGSAYLRWAKTRTPSRYDLTSSGVPYVGLRELPVTTDDLEISGTGAYGYAPLQAAIASRYRADEACVAAAMGTSMANLLALAAVVRPGDEVLIEHPTYEPLIAAARWLGAEVRSFSRRAEDGFRLDPAEVERGMTDRTRAVVLTNLHNPSSVLADDDALRQIGEIAARSGARVIVDEVYLDALWEDAPRTAFHLGETFISTNSLTKVYGLNGLRCGWILAAPEIAERAWRLTELFNNIGVHAAERLSLAAFENLDALARRSRTLLDANAAALNDFYATHGDVLDVRPHAHGTVSFPRVVRGNADALCDVLTERYETAVVPGSFFGAPDHVRIGLGVDPAKFRAGLERLGQALREVG